MAVHEVMTAVAPVDMTAPIDDAPEPPMATAERRRTATCLIVLLLEPVIVIMFALLTCHILSRKPANIIRIV